MSVYSNAVIPPTAAHHSSQHTSTIADAVVPSSSSTSTTVSPQSLDYAVTSLDSSPTRLSHSPIWSWNSSFYSQYGVTCWTNGIVPNFVTSNSSIASSYAKIIIGYLQDMFRIDKVRQTVASYMYADRLASRDSQKGQPLYLIEIGAGHGKFSFLLLKQLWDMREFWPVPPLPDNVKVQSHLQQLPLRPPFKFIMTDSSESIVNFWATHPSFAEFTTQQTSSSTSSSFHPYPHNATHTQTPYAFTHKTEDHLHTSHSHTTSPMQHSHHQTHPHAHPTSHSSSHAPSRELQAWRKDLLLDFSLFDAELDREIKLNIASQRAQQPDLHHQTATTTSTPIPPPSAAASASTSTSTSTSILPPVSAFSSSVLKQTTVTKFTNTLPIFLLGNYVFDSLRHDAFRIVDNGSGYPKLQEALISISSDSVFECDDIDPSLIKRFKHKWTYVDVPITWHHNMPTIEYYTGVDAVYNHLLAYFLKQWTGTGSTWSLLLPIGGLNCLRTFLDISHNNLVFLCGDKAYNHIEEMRHPNNREIERHPHIAIHGSFSMMVNYEAIKAFLQTNMSNVPFLQHTLNNQNNNNNNNNSTSQSSTPSGCIQTPFLDGFKVALFSKLLAYAAPSTSPSTSSLSSQLAATSLSTSPSSSPLSTTLSHLSPSADPTSVMLRESAFAFRDIQTFGPDHFSTLQRSIREECPSPSLKFVLSLLRLSQYDSEVFYKYKNNLIDRITYPHASEKICRDVQNELRHIYSTYFPTYNGVNGQSNGKDVAFELGRLAMSMKDYSQALEFFFASLHTHGTHHVTHYNIGLCFQYLHELSASLFHFEQSVALNDNYIEAKEWVARIRAKLSQQNTPNRRSSYSTPDSASVQTTPYSNHIINHGNPTTVATTPGPVPVSAPIPAGPSSLPSPLATTTAYNPSISAPTPIQIIPAHPAGPSPFPALAPHVTVPTSHLTAAAASNALPHVSARNNASHAVVNNHANVQMNGTRPLYPVTTTTSPHVAVPQQVYTSANYPAYR